METTQGYLIYEEEKSGEKTNDHPKLSAIMSHLSFEYANYKYTVYRCASKIVTLQKVFYTSSIPYKIVVAILERHRLNQANDSHPVPAFQLTSIIHDIYFSCEKLGHFTRSSSFKLETAVGLLANFFWNIFDPYRKQPLKLIEVKETFLVLCKINFDNLKSECFSLVCDHNRCVSKYRFENFLKVLTKIFTFVGESESYGSQNISQITEQCYARCPGINGMNEYQFHCIWSTTDTRFLIYSNLLALIKRIEDTEKLIHNHQCASCLSEKIIGIRFKCQVCKNVSLCMRCFSIGYNSDKHRSNHRIYEVFTDDPPQKGITQYFFKLCNFFLFQRSGEDTKSFYNSHETDNQNDTELITIDTKLSETGTVHFEDERPTKPELLDSFEGLAHSTVNISEKLQGIVQTLLEENNKLNRQLKTLKNITENDKNSFLIGHSQVLVSIIEQMKCLMDGTIRKTYPTSSTPYQSRIARRISSDSIPSNLSRSINGAEINRSYLEANKSDYSINDLSTWFHNKKAAAATNSNSLPVVIEVEGKNTDMSNFRELLTKVKEIVEDSYSDNTELAFATNNLENVLDNIIKEEEIRRELKTKN